MTLKEARKIANTDNQSMREWLDEDAVLLDMPAKEIIQYLCEEIDQTRIQRDALLDACKAVAKSQRGKHLSDKTVAKLMEAIAKTEGVAIEKNNAGGTR